MFYILFVEFFVDWFCWCQIKMASVEDDIFDAVIAGCFINIASVVLLIKYADIFSSAPKKNMEFEWTNIWSYALSSAHTTVECVTCWTWIALSFPFTFERIQMCLKTCFLKVKPLISMKNTRLGEVKWDFGILRTRTDQQSRPIVSYQYVYFSHSL